VSLADPVVFSNFGAGFSYNIISGNFAGNDFGGDVAAEGDTFTPASSLNFSSLNIALSCFVTGLCPDNFTVALNQDNGGVPGVALESFTVTGGSLGAFGSSNAPLVLTSILKPLLTAGTAYWVTVSADANDSVVWNWNSTGDPSIEAFSPDAGTSWFALGFTPGAYQVNATSATISDTPEPSTFVLLAPMMLLLLGLRNFRVGVWNRLNGHHHAK
jgi:hypothetical protein